MTDEFVEEIVKKKGKPRGGNNWLTDAALNTDPGDNTKYLLFSMQISNMEPIDLKKPQQVRQRVNEFFQLCAENDMKPAVSGLAMALGVDRRRLWEFKVGSVRESGMYAIPSESVEIIQQAYRNMELLWEQLMLNGKINPVSGIFMGKNNFGYQDKQEYVLTPNNPLGAPRDVEAIEQKYDELPD